MPNSKTIILGISSSISLYKIPSLIRSLKEQGFNMQVVMTKNAEKLMSPHIFEVISGNKVLDEIFNEGMKHIELAKKADLIVICPATANIIGKMANGIADDLLTTLILASKCPKIICPAMNTAMWGNNLVQDNMNKLKQFGFKIIEPDKGSLACGDCGKGRLAELRIIEEEIKIALSKKDLNGKKILITAGPTIEKIDAVRYLSNFSSGKMGWSLAKIARRRGAEVILISGKVAESVKKGITEDERLKITFVESAEQMYESVIKNIKNCDIFISAAAVADYKYMRTCAQTHMRAKIKKEQIGKILNLELIQNPDILKTVGELKKKPFLVGFALETENLISNARKKIKEKHLDLIIANEISNFGNDQKEAILIWKKGQKKLSLMNVNDLAAKITDKILLLNS